MAIFGPKPWVNPFGKMSIFQLFELLLFVSQAGVFSFLNIIKHIFLAYIALKKKLEKWPFLDHNDGLTRLEKCRLFDFLNFLFFQPRKAFFRSRISQNTFSWPMMPQKKKNLEKWLFFDQNHGKMSIFLLYELLVFIALKGVFLVLECIIKDIFLAYIALKKKLKKWPFLDENHGLTPLEKSQFFDYLNFFFLQPRKAFFCSRIS